MGDVIDEDFLTVSLLIDDLSGTSLVTAEWLGTRGAAVDACWLAGLLLETFGLSAVTEVCCGLLIASVACLLSFCGAAGGAATDAKVGFGLLTTDATEGAATVATLLLDGFGTVLPCDWLLADDVAAGFAAIGCSDDCGGCLFF